MLTEMGLLLTNFINCYNRQEICWILPVFMHGLELRSHEGKVCDFSLFGKSPRPYHRGEEEDAGSPIGSGMTERNHSEAPADLEVEALVHGL